MEGLSNLTNNVSHISEDLNKLEGDVDKNAKDLSSIIITVVSMNEKIEIKSIEFNK